MADKKPPIVSDEAFRQMTLDRDVRRAASLLSAKEEQHADGKEPFSLDSFNNLYDTSEDSRQSARYEELYYLVHSHVESLEEFARVLTEIDQWRD